MATLKALLHRMIDVPVFRGAARLQALLGEERVVIADVGSAGGPEARWRDCTGFCRFLTFDPDPRLT